MGSENLRLLREKREAEEKKKEEDNKLLPYDKISALTGYKTELISIMHKTVAKNTTPSELAYFLTFCQAIGLNPLNKEIWCYKDNKENVIIFTGRDGFLKKNKENPDYLGMRSSDVRDNDHFKMDMIKGEFEHTFDNKDRGKLVGAYAIVFIDGKKDTVKWVDFSEFDKGQAEWKTKPAMMIKKVAESHALKEAAGMTGIASEHDFVVKDNVAYSSVESEETETQEDKEEERLLKLIENSTSLDGLKKLFKECRTPSEIQAYDIKKKFLENIATA